MRFSQELMPHQDVTSQVISSCFSSTEFSVLFWTLIWNKFHCLVLRSGSRKCLEMHLYLNASPLSCSWRSGLGPIRKSKISLDDPAATVQSPRSLPFLAFQALVSNVILSAEARGVTSVLLSQAAINSLWLMAGKISCSIPLSRSCLIWVSSGLFPCTY